MRLGLVYRSSPLGSVEYFQAGFGEETVRVWDDNTGSRNMLGVVDRSWVAQEQHEENRKLGNRTAQRTETFAEHHDGSRDVPPQSRETSQNKLLSRRNCTGEQLGHRAARSGIKRQLPPGADDMLMGTWNTQSRGCLVGRGIIGCGALALWLPLVPKPPLRIIVPSANVGQMSDWSWERGS